MRKRSRNARVSDLLVNEAKMLQEDMAKMGKHLSFTDATAELALLARTARRKRIII